MPSINFCGDSFLRSDSPKSWCILLAKALEYEIKGLGRSGTAYEHAIKSFNNSADITIFCWTEAGRIWHPELVINAATAKARKKDNHFYQVAYLYYKYIFDKSLAEEKQYAHLYWFDHEILSHYKGKCIHLWSFEQTYEFKHGHNISIPMRELADFTCKTALNHMTEQQNEYFAETMYNLCQKL